MHCTSDVSTLTHPSPATPDKDTVDVAWRIGGAITVDQTQVPQKNPISLRKEKSRRSNSQFLGVCQPCDRARQPAFYPPLAPSSFSLSAPPPNLLLSAFSVPKVIWGPWDEAHRLLNHDDSTGCRVCSLGEHLATSAVGQTDAQSGWSRWHQDGAHRRLNHDGEDAGPAYVHHRFGIAGGGGGRMGVRAACACLFLPSPYSLGCLSAPYSLSRVSSVS